MRSTLWLNFLGCLFLLIVPTDSLSQAAKPNSWAQYQKDGKGTLTAFWFESRPFVYKDDNGTLRGVEPDILNAFTAYLRKERHVDIHINWVEADSFEDVYKRIEAGPPPSTFGVSAFSITPERDYEVDFSPPYMSDICVMISSKDVPIVNNEEEFNRVFSKLTAVTIKGTTYEQDLLRIKANSHLDFKIDFIPSNQNILRTVEGRRNTFGLIDLPVYLMLFNDNPAINVVRQNLSPIKRQGYAFILPTGSDWATPVQSYFSSPGFKSELESIISRYMNAELYHFVESLAVQSNEPVILLMKEKEIQQRDIAGKDEQIATETRRNNFLTGFVVVVLTFLILIVILYRKSHEQKRQIEFQGKSLTVKSGQLEKRNDHLMALDEEKNNLIKILAHDLRTPIQHVQGLAQVFMISNPQLTDDQRAIIQNITDASIRLNKMITHILDIDALENNRVQVFLDDVFMNTLVEQVVKSFEKPAARKNILLIYSDKTIQSKIHGDSLFLIQIFENLISNAIKFSNPGKPVEIGVREENERVIVTVKDSGPGLTADDQLKLFKRFQRLTPRPTAGEESLGLGLSIVKKYTDLMNGIVWCESEQGKGATFVVAFNKA